MSRKTLTSEELAEQVEAHLRRKSERSALIAEAMIALTSAEGFSLVSHGGDKLAVISLGDSESLARGHRAALQELSEADTPSGNLDNWLEQVCGI